MVAAAAPDRVNFSTIEVSLTAAWAKNSGTLGTPTSTV
jgi:hypothetical protein